MGKLSAEERYQFEEHVIDCPECLNEIALTDDFRHAFKQLAATGVIGTRERSFGSFNYFAGLYSLGHGAILNYAVMLILVLLTTLFGYRAHLLNNEISQLQKPAVAQPGSLTPTVAAAKTKSAPLFHLEVTRGTDITRSHPTMKINIPRTAESIVLGLDLDPDPNFQTYRAHLSDPSDETIWSDDEIPSPISGAIAIEVPSQLFRTGDYFLSLDGHTRAGRYVRVARYAFTVRLG